MAKIIFMGTPQFAVPALEMLIQNNDYEVLCVVTQPDRPVGRKRLIRASPVKEVALRHDIKILQPQRLRNSEEEDIIINLRPDFIITAAYGQILPETILKSTKIGAINIHASLLPKYRGGAPIHHAIINGEGETGITIMYMEKSLDAGNIISWQALPINPEDNVGSLHDKLSLIGASLLKETLPKLIAGTASSISQDDSLVTYAPNIKPEDERIDWSESVYNVWNRVRGLSPWPVASTSWRGNNFKIWKAEPSIEYGNENKDSSSDAEGNAGRIEHVGDNRLIIRTGDGFLSLLEVQPSGKSRMNIGDFIRGYAPCVGEYLGK